MPPRRRTVPASPLDSQCSGFIPAWRSVGLLALLAVVLVVAAGAPPASAAWPTSSSVSTMLSFDASARALVADSNFYHGVVVVWDGVDGLRAQRLDTAGQALWTTSGVRLSTSHGECAISAETYGRTWVVWPPDRTQIRFQHITTAGVAELLPDGVAIATFPDVGFPGMAVPMAGLWAWRTITWAVPRVTPEGMRYYTLFMNEFDSHTGARMRSTDAVLCDTLGGGGPYVVVDPRTGGLITFWLDRRNNPSAPWGTGQVYGARRSLDYEQWEHYGNPVGNRDVSVVCRDLAAIADAPKGGSFIAWTEPGDLLRVQRLDGAARKLWLPDGIPLGLNTGGRPVLVSRGGTGGLIVGWAQGRDLAVCSITPDGVVGPIRRDTSVVADAPTLTDLRGGSDGAGGAVFAWTNRHGSWTTSAHADGWAQRVDTTGVLRWNGWRVHTLFHPEEGSALKTAAALTDGNGGVVYVLQQGTRADHDSARGVYATRTSLHGLHGDDGPTAVLASLASVRADADRVELRWFASDAARAATVERRAADEAWESVGTVRVEGSEFVAYVDERVEAGARYAYRLACTVDGGLRYSSETWVDVPRELASGFRGIAPNPSARESVIRYALAATAEVRLDVLDAAGRRVCELLRGSRAAGEHAVTWDGRDASGRAIPPGLYFVRWRAAGTDVTARLVRVSE